LAGTNIDCTCVPVGYSANRAMVTAISCAHFVHTKGLEGSSGAARNSAACSAAGARRYVCIAAQACLLSPPLCRAGELFRAATHAHPPMARSRVLANVPRPADGRRWPAASPVPSLLAHFRGCVAPCVSFLCRARSGRSRWLPSSPETVTTWDGLREIASGLIPNGAERLPDCPPVRKRRMKQSICNMCHGSPNNLPGE